MHDTRASHSHVEIFLFTIFTCAILKVLYPSRSDAPSLWCCDTSFPSTPADNALSFEPCTCRSCEHFQLSLGLVSLVDGRNE